jgi:hypothetical protein
MNPPVATVPFTDGVARPVYEEDDRQYVIDDGGERVYGVWILADEPVIQLACPSESRPR